MVITQEALKVLSKRRFINIATCDNKNRPNVAPKFVLKVDGGHIYLIDYVMNTTLKNIKINNKVSLSTIDKTSLNGYQINGTASVLKKDSSYKELLKEYNEKQIMLSTDRIIKTIQGEKQRALEVQLPEKVTILKVKINEIVRICLTGNLDRENI